MVVTAMNSKIFGGNLYLNSTPAMKFYFDTILSAIAEFTASLAGLVVESFPCIYTRTRTQLQLFMVKVAKHPVLPRTKLWSKVMNQIHRVLQPKKVAAIVPVSKFAKLAYRQPKFTYVFIEKFSTFQCISLLQTL